MKISIKKINQVGDVSVSTNPTVGKLALRSGAPGPAGPAGPAGTSAEIILNDTFLAAGNTTAAATANVANALYALIIDSLQSTGDTMTGPLVIEFEGEGLYVNADAQIVNDLRVGEVLRVGDFELSSNNFTTTADGEIVIDTFSTSTYSTVKYVIQLSNASNIHATELFCMQNGVSAYATEYATLLSGAPLGYFSIELSGGNAQLKFQLNNPSNAIYNIHLLRHALRF